jgi:hypothetical protein
MHILLLLLTTNTTSITTTTDYAQWYNLRINDTARCGQSHV